MEVDTARRLAERVVLVTRKDSSEPYGIKQIAAFALAAIVGILQLPSIFRKEIGMPWDWDAEQVMELLSAPISRLPLDSVLFALFMVVLFVAIALVARGMNQRLVFDQAGIHFTSRLPELFKRLQPDWSISWYELQSVSVGRGHPFFSSVPATLLFEGIGRKHTLQVGAGWQEEGKEPVEQPKQRKSFRFDLNPKKLLEAAVEDNLVIETLTQFGVKIDRTPSLPDKLKSHPAGHVVTAIVIACFLYALAEMFLLHETYAEGLPILPLMLVAIFGLVVGLLIARLARLPFHERILLPALVATGLVFAAFPGLLRLNILTDSAGPVLVEYQHAGNSVLRPLDPAWPEIHAPRFERYWNESGRDEIHVISVRKGGLGFHQYNHVRIRKQAFGDVQ